MAIYGHRHFVVLCAVLAALADVPCLRAATPAVTAALSSDQAAVGQTVQLQIRVTGARGAEVPNDIAVDGLEIHQTGTEQHFEMNNLTVSQSIVYSYTVLPLKAGAFKISPQTIRIAGNSLRTPELVLRVAGSGSRQAAPNSGGSQPIDTSKFVNAELIVPKKSAYVGEMIPVVVKIATAARISSLEPPEITGQGFTMQKLQTPDQPQIEMINGRQWEVYSFKTAISPVRPGKLDIGPVKANARVVVPAASRPRSRSRSPFDIFNLDDPFSDPFFADPFGRFSERREVTIASEPVTLDVKALPSNPPVGFSGAVGNFNMQVDANPKSVQVGDPITVKSAISGRGNFDRITAPALRDKQGWHEYPPNSKFEKDDDVGISGTKSFEMVLSPNDKKKQISPFVFSYFDPAREQYQTLQSDAIPIQVEGGAMANATVSPAQMAPPAPAKSKPSPTPQAGVADILYQLTDRPARPQSFLPLYARTTFWIAQAPALLALVGFVGFQVRKARSDNREAQRSAALQHKTVELMRNLRRPDISASEYFSSASRAVQLKTALAGKVDPNSVDVDTAAKVFSLNEASRNQLRQLFERSDELRYSGGASNGNLSPENRREILELVESLRT
jgi:hypothetical protein